MKRSIPILLFFFVLTLLSAKPQRLKVLSHLTMNDGMSSNSITCILEDSHSYLWVGTYNGLNRYDGLGIDVFKNTYDRQLLASSRIRHLVEDKNGIIWIGTEDGLSIYNYKNESFTHVLFDRQSRSTHKGPAVFKIVETDTKVFCITADASLYIFDHSFHLLEQVQRPSQVMPQGALVTDACMPCDTQLIFSTTQGLLHLDVNTLQYSFYSSETIQEVSSLSAYDDKLLLTLDYGIAILQYRYQDGKLDYWLVQKNLKRFRFFTSYIDKDRNIWLGERNRGVRYINNIDALEQWKPYQSYYFSLKGKPFRSRAILPSDKNTCWVGTFNKGLYRFDTRDNPFHWVKMANAEKKARITDNTRRISTNDGQSFYVISNTGELKLFDANNETFVPLPKVLKPYVSEPLEFIFKDSRACIWLKPYASNQLLLYTPSTDKVQNVNTSKQMDLSEFRSMEEDRYGQMWIQSLRHIYRLEVDKQGVIVKLLKVTDHPSFDTDNLPYIRSICLDVAEDLLWLGTIHDGLLRIRYSDQVAMEHWPVDSYRYNADKLQSISSNFVTSIIQSMDSTLFVGTVGGGICRVDKRTKQPEFWPYTEVQGLSHDDVQSMVADHDGMLWIGTVNGLNRFNPETNNCTKFYVHDGLPFDEFAREVCCLKNGKMVFSNLEGFFIFDKDEIRENRDMPPLILSDFTLYNEQVKPGDVRHRRVVLEQSIDQTKMLKLHHDENVFSLKARSLHYSNPENYHIKYQLLPSQEEWIVSTSDKNVLYFNGLRPGKYELRVAVSNTTSTWSTPRVLTIRILAPWFASRFMLGLYFCLFALIVYLIERSRSRFTQLHHKYEIEQMAKKQVHEISEAKLNYFSNISHEIKTPISLIAAPSAQLAEMFQMNPKVLKKVKLIQSQSKKITALINQVHDFQKLDAENLKLNKTKFYFNTFLAELIEDYYAIAEDSERELHVGKVDEPILVCADRDKLGKIISNLLSNAFKFTRKNDFIGIDYKLQEDTLVVKIHDTGIGIKSSEADNIFKLFYHSAEKQKNNIGGSGIGLAFAKRLIEMHEGTIRVESDEGLGATFWVSLPIVKQEEEQEIKQKEVELLCAEEAMDEGLFFEENQVNDTLQVNDLVKGKKVFLVEDHLVLRLFLAELLVEQGFKVASFANGQECINALKRTWPHVIVSDILMPEVNGLELCRYVKSDEAIKHIPVILLTACSSSDERVKGFEYMPDSFISKPFDVNFLINELGRLVMSNIKQVDEQYMMSTMDNVMLEKDDDDDRLFLQKLNEIMSAEISNKDLDINSFAKQLYLNRTHFYRKVKALTGRTPYDLMKKIRLDKAAAMLVEDNFSVNDVFLATGFKSKPHFNKSFKECFETTPSKYQLVHRQH